MNAAEDSTQTNKILQRIAGGDNSAVDELLCLQRGYLRRVVDLRMEDQLRGRVDPSDVVQETMLAISKRINDYLERRPMSFRVWARRVTVERLIDVSRDHHRAKRSVRRQVSLSEASSMALSRHFVRESPSQVLDRKEQADLVRKAIDRLRPMDREVILLRHVEELSNAEVAEVLEIAPDAASKRYGRAVVRLASAFAGGETKP